jgi:hypothetical protein
MTVAPHIAASPVVFAGPGLRNPQTALDVEFTILMPFLGANASALRCTVDRIADALYAQGISFEVLAVTDATEEGFEAEHADLPGTRFVVNPGIRDRASALEAGFGAARGRWLGIVDVDQDAPVEPYELVERLHRAREAEFALL